MNINITQEVVIPKDQVGIENATETVIPKDSVNISNSSYENGKDGKVIPINVTDNIVTKL